MTCVLALSRVDTPEASVYKLARGRIEDAAWKRLTLVGSAFVVGIVDHFVEAALASKILG